MSAPVSFFFENVLLFRIIPFLAADALDLKKETLKESIPIDKHDTGQLELGINIFKPPVKTEGIW